MKKWQPNKKSEKLFKTFLKLKTIEEVANFCTDLMTQKELDSFVERLEVAEKLNQGISQRNVSSSTGVSIATVTRVNQWLTRGSNGYKTVLSRLNHHHPQQGG